MADSQPHVDLIFPALGQTIRRDHGYALYGAISRIVPAVHDPASGIGIFPIRGTPGSEGTLRLVEGRSAVRLRTPADRLPALLPLAGKALDVDGHRLRLGVPRVAALVPAAAVASPVVLIKLAGTDAGTPLTPDAFLAAARRQLADLGIRGEADIPLNRAGPKAGQPRRRVVRVKGRVLPGYAVVVTGLTAEESILLQERGLGGRRGMGCGLFLPAKEGD